MASWAALNVEAPRASPEHARDVATEEAQEARYAVLYERALRRQQQRKNDEAKAIYTQLLETSLGLSPRLRYLCAKNLATLEAELLAYDAAVKRFSEALALDATDVLVWYQLGKAALATGQLWLARQALESGFQVDAQFWPLVHLLCDVLHTIGDDAAYNRVAQYLLKHDPDAAAGDGPLRAMDIAVGPSFRVLKSLEALGAPQHHSQPVKRRSIAVEASLTGVKKRKLAMEMARDDAQRVKSRAPLTYLLQKSSWLSLGKLLLEAYQDVLSEQKDLVDVTTLRNVRVSVDFLEEPEPTPVPSRIEEDTVASDVPLPAAPIQDEAIDIDLTGEDIVQDAVNGTSVGPIDVDQEDDEQHESEDARQTSRRKSRRHEEKLREEHELAAKQAREKNLAYRLQAFVPTAIDEGDASARSEDVVFRVREGSVILETVDGAELHAFADVFPRVSRQGSQYSSASSESEAQVAEGYDDATRLVDREEISEFAEQAMGAAEGYHVLHLLRRYLNQSGKWAERQLDASSEKVPIHPVILWAEKAVSGRLEPHDDSTTVNNAATAGQVGLSRQLTHGFACETRLFFLELRLDEILRQYPQRGPTRARRSSRSAASQLDDMQGEAQRLLFDLCWSQDDSCDTHDVTTPRLLVRLLWFCGLVCEYRGEINDAKDYFAKCKQELETIEEQGALHLVNLHHPVEISVSSVEFKIGSLQSTDKGVEAKEMAAVAHFDEAQTRLLDHFFPTNAQTSRIEDLLEDFAASQTEATSRPSADEENAEEGNLLEHLLQTVEQSSNAPCSKKILILLIVLDELLKSLRATRKEALSTMGRSDKQQQIKHSSKLFTTVQAIKLTVDRLAAVVAADANTDASVCAWTRKAAVMGLSKLLEPSTVLLFDSPRDVLVVVCYIEELLCGAEAPFTPTDDSNTPKKLREHLLLTIFKSFRAIRSLPAPNLQRLLDVSSINSSGKTKRKPSTRRDRVRPFIHGVLASLVTGFGLLNDGDFQRSDAKTLMEDCCLLLKEEEEILGRRQESDKVGRKIVATGAVLFLHLFVALSSHPSKEDGDSTKALVALVDLLHERLGQHELCAAKCVDVGGKEGGSFVAVAVDYLSDRRADFERVESAHRQTTTDSGPPSEAGVGDGTIDNEDRGSAEKNDNDVGQGFDETLAQCFRCLYDIHITTNCADHKTDAAISHLEDGPLDKAVQLARFAIPMMLQRLPRNIAQKKDNLKILFALRRAADMDNELRESPVQPSDVLLRYMKPLSILSWKEEVPVAAPGVSSSHEAESLENLWFLLGENFILHRVRRRSNLTELIEMERRVKERVAFLVKDVQQYRPGRIRSWTRLGKVLKELYQVASDACSLLLNQLRVADALSALAKSQDPHAEDTNGAPSFEDFALDISMFERIKEWEDEEGPSQKSSFRVKLGNEANPEAQELTSDDTTSGYRIEEFAVLYLSQLIEFARRCFDMAAAQARARVIDGDESMSASTNEYDEHDQAELKDLIVECYEESGLLLYTYLQEFSLLRRRQHAKSTPEPRKVWPELYHKVLNAAHKHFEEALSSSQADNVDAHDVRFRLQFMIGKVLKKKVWLQQLRASLPPPTEDCVTTDKLEATRSIMACFAAAEDEHEKGKMEKSIVHAFYQLQAMRLELILNEPATVKQLTLACDYYFEEADEDEDDSDDDDDEPMADEDDKPNEDKVVKVGKDDVAAILSLADSSAEAADYLCLARAWLFYNVIDALESISDEDRYFHPSRHAVARAMYHFHETVRQLAAIVDCPLPEAVAKTSPTACISMLEEKMRKKKNDGSSPAEAAVKEMHALFDKRRPQVVAIWLSEHVPTSKKFEELNQRQIKFDVCRLKYLRYYVDLLKESQAYARIKEIGSWVLACKEEHDAISEMLAVVFHARGVVQLSRLKDFVCSELVDQLQRFRAQNAEMVADEADEGKEGLPIDAESAQVDDPRETLVKELGKAYVNYVDVAESSVRLAAVLSELELQELALLAEFPVVCLFVIGAIEFPADFEPKETADAPSLDEISPKIRAMLLNEDLSLAICGPSEWKCLLDMARAFCESRWPDRHIGKAGAASKPSRKPRLTKASSSASSAAAPPPAAVAVLSTEEPSAAASVDDAVVRDDASSEPPQEQPSPSKAVPAEI